MKQKTIAVIGLGSFGTTVAKMLASMNHEVLGVSYTCHRSGHY